MSAKIIRDKNGFMETKFKRNPDYYARKSKQSTLKLYGLTEAEYNNLFEKQEGCCKICGIHQTQLKRKLHIDHCHETGKVRGLLCVRCNTGLGQFKDNLTLLESAVKYLKGK